MILRSFRFGEADRVLHVYTADRGRVGAVAKATLVMDTIEPLARSPEASPLAQFTFWVVEAVPTPIRILQRDDDGDTLELRLIDYQEA